MAPKQENVVWVSNAMMDTRLTKGFRNDLEETDSDRAIELIKKVLRGKALPSDEFPLKFFHKIMDPCPKSLPDLMQSRGHYVVSDRLCDALKTADMGSTSFHPVELFEYDRTRRIDMSYSIIAFGETKNTILLEQSRFRQGPYEGNLPTLCFDPKDVDLTLSEQALCGPDLWIEKRFSSAFFLSDRLVKTLKTEKLTRRLGLLRCRISADSATQKQG